MNNKTIKNLILSGILAFVFMSAGSVYAEGFGSNTNTTANTQTSTASASPFRIELINLPTSNNISNQGSAGVMYVNPSTMNNPVVATNTTSVATTTTTITQPPVTTTTVTPTTTAPVVQTQSTQTSTAVKPKTTTTVKPSSSNLPPVNMEPVSNTNSDLTALSINGSGGFMPSSFFQWFLLILLILAIIIIARRVASKPAGHGAHPAPAH